MMKTILMLVGVFVTCVSQVVVYAQQPSVTMENVQAEYKSLAEVRPVLFNSEDKPIYLLPTECGEALVISLGDGTAGGYSSDLKPCPEVVSPIEVKPGEIYHLPGLVLRLEVDEGEFVEERNGQPGKYQITISYSFKPTYRDGKPQLKISITKEFRISK